MIRLTVRHQTQPDSEEVVEFDKDIITIGRHSENDVVLGERTVSRKHAQIEKDGDRYLIKDLESHFGVFVNKRKVLVEEISLGGEIYITPFIIRFDVVEAAGPAADVPTDEAVTVDGPAPQEPEAAYPESEYAPEPEPAAESETFDLPQASAPFGESEPAADPFADLPGLEPSAPEPPPPSPQEEEISELDEDGTLMKWDGHTQQTDAQEEPGPALGFTDDAPTSPTRDAPMEPYEVDETPPPPPPPPPKPSKPLDPLKDPFPPMKPSGKGVESSGFQPWDRAVRDDDEEDVLEEILPTRRGDKGPLGIVEQARVRELNAGIRYGRLRGALLGFLMLLLPFFPVSASQGNVTFFWDFMELGIFDGNLFPLLGGGVLGLLTLLASIFRGGLIRGFLQVVFAGGYIGLVAGIVFEGTLAFRGTKVPLSFLVENFLLLALILGFALAVVGSRTKVYHPKKIIPRLLCLVGGGAILAVIFLPPDIVGLTGLSFFDQFRKIIEAPEIRVFWVVNLGLLALLGLIAVTNVFPWSGPFRSRMVLLFAFYLLLYPLVDFLVETVQAGINNTDTILLVSGARLYLIGFVAVWILFIGLASFLGNVLVSLNYNEQMMLARQ
ncbi:MAG: FHA domain-containing protein [Planctomycetota bacterium]|jgi:hypothetical protein